MNDARISRLKLHLSHYNQLKGNIDSCLWINGGDYNVISHNDVLGTVINHDSDDLQIKKLELEITKEKNLHTAEVMDTLMLKELKSVKEKLIKLQNKSNAILKRKTGNSYWYITYDFEAKNGKNNQILAQN